jgi:hypothetical protein
VRTLITDARYLITSDQTECLIAVNLTGKYMILESIHLRIRYLIRMRYFMFCKVLRLSVRAASSELCESQFIYIRTYAPSPKMVLASRLEGHAKRRVRFVCPQ